MFKQQKVLVYLKASSIPQQYKQTADLVGNLLPTTRI